MRKRESEERRSLIVGGGDVTGKVARGESRGETWVVRMTAAAGAAQTLASVITATSLDGPS